MKEKELIKKKIRIGEWYKIKYIRHWWIVLPIFKEVTTDLDNRRIKYIDFANSKLDFFDGWGSISFEDIIDIFKLSKGAEK